MRFINHILLIAAFTCGKSVVYAQTFDFSVEGQQLNTIGRGDCHVEGGVLHSRDNYALFGDNTMKDYAFSFKARAPKGEEQVQIWAGFRAANRYDRYVVGLKGGLQDDIYLMRLGYRGTDEFLGVRPLRFHPVPGEWYKMRIEVSGQRIRVYVGDEQKPYIDVTDKNGQQCQSGYVTLGGGWIDTEFDDLVISPLKDNAFDGQPRNEFRQEMTSKQRELKREKERQGYHPIVVQDLQPGRTEISLDGNWLFMPEYQINDIKQAIEYNDDKEWHVMQVPNFWNPIRIWLHGETMATPNGHEPKGVSDTYYQSETDRCENYTFDYRKTNSAWYRQHLDLPSNVKGKIMTLSFDAVSKTAEVYINGHRAGSHIGMFGNFEVDCSKLLHPGRNIIAVRVLRNINDDSKAKNDLLDAHYALAQGNAVREGMEENNTTDILRDMPHGFYGGDPAGIWQPVKLTITNAVKIEDAYIKPRLNGASFEIAVKNHSTRKTTFNLSTDIKDKATGHIIYSGPCLKKVTLSPGEERILTYEINNLQPKPWTPQHPNLYEFTFRTNNDALTVTSGFRTFEVKNGLFQLNGVNYWLRGGNQVPSAICPNDKVLAHKFYQLMKQGNIEVTRMHTAPFNETWMQAADEEGIAVSFEGTWPWLMLENRPIPSQELLDLWKNEMKDLMRKYRNHPSLIIWTVNNEMKFYDLDQNKERAMRKMTVISDFVREMRKVDPTRPISYDSNYSRKGRIERYGQAFYNTIDDGDIDDVHAYYNWYDYNIFRFFNGEFEKNAKLPDRPLISQEMSTGYPNNETGHPTRSYQIVHQNPMSLCGYKAYDFCNPKYFLNTQAFITGELAEVLRRSCPNGSGILHFSLHTWFKEVYDAEKIKPWPTYHALARALQPVLVSAELWGRHFYAGEQLPTRICIVNDREDGSTLLPTLLSWQIVTEDGQVLTNGKENIRAVNHYEHYWIGPKIQLPRFLPQDKLNVKLVLKLQENNKIISENEYGLTLANRQLVEGCIKNGKIAVLGDDSQLSALKVEHQKYHSLVEIIGKKAYNSLLNGKSHKKIGTETPLVVLSGKIEINENDKKVLRSYQKQGGNILLLECPDIACKLYPEYIIDYQIPTEGDITFMENEDDPVFDGIDVMELRYFNDNKREMPRACSTILKTVRSEQIEELGGQMKIHAYIDGGKPEDRIKRLDQLRGYTLLRIKDGAGKAIISTLCTGKSSTDPIAAQLFNNLIKCQL